jgi:putative acetyltransferase
MITVTPASPTDPGPAALLAAAQAHQAETYAPEHNFSLSTEALAAPDIKFFAAREDGAVLGVGALKVAGDFGEVKSMFTAPEARGRGVAERILTAIESTARGHGLGWLRLETGEELAAAVRLYRRAGFARCGPFGRYEENGSSVFMEKRLD